MTTLDEHKTNITANVIIIAWSNLIVTAKAEQIPKTCKEIGLFKYYDYSFLDLAASSIYYKLVGIGKDFSNIFVSSKSYVNLEDSGLKKAIQRKKSLIKYNTQEEKSLKKSRNMNKNEELVLRGNNNGKWKII